VREKHPCKGKIAVDETLLDGFAKMVAWQPIEQRCPKWDSCEHMSLSPINTL